MERLADGLCYPLLLHDLIEKEIEAVENNYEMILKNSNWRIKHLIELLSNDQSFCNKSKKINLENWDHEALRKALIAFHDRYYHASQMFAVVLGKDSIPDLIKNSVEIYQEIPNKNIGNFDYKRLQ